MPPSSSTSSTSALLAKIRSELEAIPPHSLPSDWLPSANATNNKTAPLLFDPALLTRYKTARDSYLLARTSQLFLSALSSYDAATGTFSFPAPPTEEDEEELKRGEEEVLREVKETMRRMDGKTTEVWETWRGMERKREELLGLLGEMEREERERRLATRGEGDDVESDSDDDRDDSDDDEEEEITEEELQRNEQSLRDMQRRKSQLESKLRLIKAQILDAEDDVHRTKRAVNEVRVGCGQAPLEWRAHGDGDDSDDTSYERIEEMVQAELREMERRHEKLKESKEYYDGMRELMEELGGVKILNSKTIGENNDGRQKEENGEAASESAGKRRKTDTSEQHKEETRGTTDEPLAQQHPQQNADFVLTIMLLDKHILELVVRNGKPANVESADFQQNHDANSQRYVHSAKLKTGTSMPIKNHDNNNNNSDSNHNHNHSDEHTTTQQHLLQTIHDLSFTSTSLSKILSQTPSRSVSIPPLHDLVSWSHSFDTTQERIRFVVVETMARLRVMEARVWELDELKRRFVAVQIYDKEVAGDDFRDRVNGGNGEKEGEGENESMARATPQPQPHPGAEQEVVIAIDEGITLAMRLGADCPLLPGSVYISEMFGMGAWRESQLEELKKAVVERRCMGPVEVMEVILEEIERRRESGEWKREEESLMPCLPGVGGGRMMME